MNRRVRRRSRVVSRRCGGGGGNRFVPQLERFVQIVQPRHHPLLQRVRHHGGSFPAASLVHVLNDAAELLELPFAQLNQRGTSVFGSANGIGHQTQRQQWFLQNGGQRPPQLSRTHAVIDQDQIYR